MPQRKALSKGRRFDIFRRDGFTCQYCGRQPPEVVLEPDHIVPVVEGGTNEEMNLVASCRDCNRGKGRKLLDAPPRPDADLAWLEMQQEVAELQAYQESKCRRDELVDLIAAQFQTNWIELAGDYSFPTIPELKQLMTRFSPRLVEAGLNIVAVKVAAGYFSGRGWLPYLWGTLKNLNKQHVEE